MVDHENTIARMTNNAFYIDFKYRRYLVDYAPDIHSKSMLDLDGFNIIDDAMAHPIMRLISAGCETVGCCAGHIPRRQPYIAFRTLTDQARGILKRIPFCQIETTELNEWPCLRAHVNSPTEWMEFILALHRETECMKNLFTEWRFVNIKCDGNVFTRTGIMPASSRIVLSDHQEQYSAQSSSHESLCNDPCDN